MNDLNVIPESRVMELLHIKSKTTMRKLRLDLNHCKVGRNYFYFKDSLNDYLVSISVDR